MNRQTKKILTWGALGLGAYSLFKAANQPAIAAPVNGLGQVDPGSIMQLHPGGAHPAHPYWRWWRGASDANQSTFASPYYGQPLAYNPWQYFGGGGGSTFGGYLDYDAEEYEQPGSLAERSAQYT